MSSSQQQVTAAERPQVLIRWPNGTQVRLKCAGVRELAVYAATTQERESGRFAPEDDGCPVIGGEHLTPAERLACLSAGAMAVIRCDYSRRETVAVLSEEENLALLNQRKRLDTVRSM